MQVSAAVRLIPRPPGVTGKIVLIALNMFISVEEVQR
jgi:hypothetical protein